MSTVDSIEKAIESLDERSFAALRAWFIEYDHSRWDRQIERDGAAGKLDKLIGDALDEHRAGKTRPL